MLANDKSTLSASSTSSSKRRCLSQSLIKEEGGLVCRRLRSGQAKRSPEDATSSQDTCPREVPVMQLETPSTKETCPLLPIIFGYKTFTDAIHGQIELPALCVRILNTPEMQRLQRLKQLGVCDSIFRCANHTRLEHSIGVAHCAHVLLSNLQEQYRRAKKQRKALQGIAEVELFCPPKITESDWLCVLVAALCHDLGHGPFSHQFESLKLTR